jgi:putative addiction module killer protein
MLNIFYDCGVKEIRRTGVFINWVQKLRDSRARFRIYERIRRLAQGNPGDVKPAGEGISELRIAYGPGYRLYYKDTGKEIVILLCGGDKTTQQADIARAKKLAKLPLEDAENEEEQ